MGRELPVAKGTHWSSPHMKQEGADADPRKPSAHGATRLRSDGPAGRPLSFPTPALVSSPTRRARQQGCFPPKVTMGAGVALYRTSGGRKTTRQHVASMLRIQPYHDVDRPLS